LDRPYRSTVCIGRTPGPYHNFYDTSELGLIAEEGTAGQNLYVAWNFDETTQNWRRAGLLLCLENLCLNFLSMENCKSDYNQH